ncbi:MAG TPA: amino acid adenylation domain-containing protein, partial [Longimicrobium sp.]
ELTARLKALSARHGTTLFMTVLAGWAVVLGRLAGQDDVLIGTPTANRGLPEVEGMIGFFTNTVPVRVDLSGSPTIPQLLARVRDRALGAQKHQDIPFEQVVERIRPTRSLSHSPVFQVMLAWQNAPAGDLVMPGLEISRVPPPDHETSKIDLLFDLRESGGRITGEMEYATALWGRPTAERYVGYLVRVLEAMVADESARVEDLSLLAGAERDEVVEQWNATDADFPRGACIHELFEAQVKLTPDAEALLHDGVSLTYRELNERANRLAHHLRGLGAGPEVRVGISLERGPEMVVALLATLKAGSAYVPLDPAYPAERLAFTLRDAGVAVLVTQEKVRGLLQLAADVRVVSVDGAATEIAAEPADNPRGGADARSLAYLIYTSGSTGLPKGVAIEHESAVALLSWAAGVYTAEELSGVLASTSIAFDLSVFEIFLPLSRGGRIILVENALALPDSPSAGEVRLVNTVPSAITALLKNEGLPAGVRTVNLAGEPLRVELVDALYARPGIERVYDLYGPSEDTTYSTFTLRTAGGPATIGKPISNTRAYVVDSSLQPVPVGVVGELYLAGAGLARGYLGRAALTAERFVPDPFSGEPGGRLYRTGDRVRWRTDGTLQYLGRSDHQVKVRGFRIEPGEIEARLMAHPEVREAVVVVREDAPGEKRLVAYFAGEEMLEAQTLRAHLAEKLPEHMVPAAYVRVDRLPLTPNGKLDRKALPAPDGDAFATRDYEAPVGDTETALAEVWAGVLGVDRVGRWDNFFDLGGHSLMAVQIVSRVRQTLGVEVKMAALFERPVLADFARGLEQAARTEEVAITPADRSGPLDASFAQQRLWFMDRLEGGSAFYNMPSVHRLGGELDLAALERALVEVVRRHESLRTVFGEANGSPVQVITPWQGFALPVDDLTQLDAAAREAEVMRLAGEDANRLFDLAG